MNQHGDALDAPPARPPGDLEASRRQQRLLAEFGAIALRAAGLHEVAGHAVRFAAEGLDAPFAQYLHLREGKGDLLLMAGTGWAEGTVGRDVLAADAGSPAGYALRSDAPVLSRDLASETRFRTPPLLARHGVRSAINAPVGDEGGPLGVLEVDSDVPGAFTEADADFVQGLANVLSGAIARDRRERDLRAARRRQALLADEMRHRVKNLFSSVLAVIALTRREAAETQTDPLALLTGRIDALREAGEAGLEGRRGAVPTGEGGGWVDPVDLSRRVLRPYGARVAVEGEAPLLTPGQAGPIAVILHELAVNAARHGALSGPSGTVAVRWTAPGPAARLRWRETGGPALPGPPRSSGFGLGLMRRLVVPLSADLALDWAPDGLSATLQMVPEARPAAA